jgi:hypothetical protein
MLLPFAFLGLRNAKRSPRLNSNCGDPFFPIERWKRNTVAGDISKATCGTDEIFKTLPEGIAMENAKKRNVENRTLLFHLVPFFAKR